MCTNLNGVKLSVVCLRMPCIKHDLTSTKQCKLNNQLVFIGMYVFVGGVIAFSKLAAYLSDFIIVAGESWYIIRGPVSWDDCLTFHWTPTIHPITPSAWSMAPTQSIPGGSVTPQLFYPQCWMTPSCIKWLPRGSMNTRSSDSLSYCTFWAASIPPG